MTEAEFRAALREMRAEVRRDAKAWAHDLNLAIFRLLAVADADERKN